MYTEENFFDIKYNTRLDRLEFKDRRWTSRFTKFVKEHKFITISLITFFVFSTFNIILIYNFMRILTRI